MARTIYCVNCRTPAVVDSESDGAAVCLLPEDWRNVSKTGFMPVCGAGCAKLFRTKSGKRKKAA